MANGPDGKPTPESIVTTKTSATGRVSYENTDALLDNKKDKNIQSVIDAAENWYKSEHSKYKPSKEEKADGMLKTRNKDVDEGLEFYKKNVLSQEIADSRGNETALNLLKDKYNNQANYNKELKNFSKESGVNAGDLNSTISHVVSSTNAGEVLSKNLPNTVEQQKQVWAEDKKDGYKELRTRTESAILENENALEKTAVLKNSILFGDNKGNHSIEFEGYNNSFKIQNSEQAYKNGETRLLWGAEKENLKATMPKFTDPIEPLSTEPKAQPLNTNIKDSPFKGIDFSELAAASSGLTSNETSHTAIDSSHTPSPGAAVAAKAGASASVGASVGAAAGGKGGGGKGGK